MGFSFKKRKKILPGVTLNISTKSVGVRVGGRNAGVSVNSRSGARVGASIPGTGVSVSQRLTGKAKNSRAATIESSGYERVASCKGTLREFGLSTPVRLSSKTTTPTGSQISVVTAVADIDYRIDASGGITLLNAKLSRCDGNLASERTGESWRGDSLTPSALLAAANEDLQLDDSNLVRCIIGNASRSNSNPMGYVWATLALPIASIGSVLCLAVGVMLCFGPYWIAGIVMLCLALAAFAYAWKAFRVFKPKKL